MAELSKPSGDGVVVLAIVPETNKLIIQSDMKQQNRIIEQ